MSQTSRSVTIVDNDTVQSTSYDAVIVGGGIAGAITAKKLSEQGKTVLIIEAGTAEGLTLGGFQSYIDRFYTAVDKHGNAPYPANWNAASPTDDSPYPYVYFEEKGPLPLSGSYTRILGGTTMHWEGKTLRMLPDDFKLNTLYGHGLDWPISYDDLEAYYQKAEIEIGVSGNTQEQRDLGIPFNGSYELPMLELPPSYLDQQVADGLAGMTITLNNKEYDTTLSTFPQGRNSIPNPGYTEYNNGHPYVPYGIAADDAQFDFGERCQGNANCVSICPVQAKYDARKALHSIRFPERVHLLPQAVAHKVDVDASSGDVAGINYKIYNSIEEGDTTVTTGIAQGQIYILAANAIENAKLMLGSEIANLNPLMGCNLMDHPFLLSWGLMPSATGTMRGPLVTSGIASLRKGDFRDTQCAFGIDIHNDGWGWSGTGVNDIVREAIDSGLHGFELRQELVSKISRQLLLAVMCELPAIATNRVTVNEDYKDQLGNYRPVIHFDLPDYVKEGFKFVRGVSEQIFDQLNVDNCTKYRSDDPAYFEYDGLGYWFRGGNHFSGTHIMGSNASESVVDENLKSWEHQNLYMLGSGSMPSIGTSNTTLTIVALCFKALEQMLVDLGSTS